MKHVLSERIAVRRIVDLRENPGNARKHSRQQVEAISRLIQRYGWTNPVLISSDDTIVAGHGRIAAARKLGLTDVPTICLSHLRSKPLLRRDYTIAVSGRYATSCCAAQGSWPCRRRYTKKRSWRTSCGISNT